MLCYARPSVCESSGANGGTKIDHDGEPYIVIPSYEVLLNDAYLFIPGISGPLLLPAVDVRLLGKHRGRGRGKRNEKEA